MDVLFRSNSLASTCNKRKKLVKKVGEKDARLVLQRLNEIAAADNLADLMKLPGPNCHPLREDRKGTFAVDLTYPYRLVFKPGNNPVPKKDDGGIDVAKVTKVMIVELKVDYHGR